MGTNNHCHPRNNAPSLKSPIIVTSSSSSSNSKLESTAEQLSLQLSVATTDPANLPGTYTKPAASSATTMTTAVSASSSLVQPRVPSPSSHHPQQVSTAKRRKTELDNIESWKPPSWYLSPEQIQVLQNLRLNRSILTPSQVIELEKLEHNFIVMSQHQKTVKIEIEKQRKE